MFIFRNRFEESNYVELGSEELSCHVFNLFENIIAKHIRTLLKLCSK